MLYDGYTRECNAGGVQIRDLAAETAPKRAQNASGELFLERVRFVKHEDSACLADLPSIKQNLDQYSECVSQTLNAVWPTISTKMPALAHSPLIAAAMDNVKAGNGQALNMTGPVIDLLNDLTKCDDVGKMRENVLKRAEILDGDTLLGSALTERLLKPALDITIENMRGHESKSALINAHTLSALRALDDMADTHPLIDMEWTVVSTDADQLQMQVLEAENFAAEVVKFDALNSNDSVPAGLKHEHDFIVLDRCLHWSTDIQRCIHRLKDLIHDDGFAVVIENTGKFELTFLLDALRCEQLPATGDGNRVYGE